MNNISKGDLSLLNKLTEFYKNEDNLRKMLSIVEGQSKITLRILDWFVTNYAKKKIIICKLSYTDDYNIIYNDYKSQLNSYYKKRFDPFCRHDRICFYYDDENNIITTIGQLNFFRWAIEKEIIDYVLEHIDEIEKDMYNTSEKIYQKKNKNNRKKRSVISKIANLSINKYNMKIKISFD